MNAQGLGSQMLAAWKNRDWDAIRVLLHPDYVYTGPDGQRVIGIEAGVVAGWSSFADSFPDGDYEILGEYVDGQHVVTEFRFTGTQTGEFEGIAPTNNKVEVDFCNVMRLQDKKVIAERDYLDTHGLLSQLGVN